jgi:hypothetical protein
MISHFDHGIEKEESNVIEITLLPNPDAKDESENQGMLNSIH